MEEGTKKQEEAKAANEPTDSILEKQPAPTPPQGESEADTSEEDVPQELKVWGYGGAEGGGYWLQEDAVSIPGSAEEDEENEAIQAMALGLELQCRLQLHLDQLEAKAKAKAKSRARARARARAAAAMAARRGSPEPAAGTSANLAAAARPQPSVPRGSQGEPHVRAQERGAALGQAAEEVKPGEKGGRHPFGAPVRKTGKGPRGKEAAAKAREGPPASSPPSICQRRDKCPNLELKGSRATASGTPVARSLERPRAHLGSSWREAEEAFVYPSPPCSLSEPETFASGGREESQAPGKSPAPGPTAEENTKEEPPPGTEGLVPTRPQAASSGWVPWALVSVKSSSQKRSGPASVSSCAGGDGTRSECKLPGLIC
ncbi:uncharacterized protein LOC141548475 isoform X3 [Sminthopsis crassicaudata]|uniref:uncharacterized protein LOC141548475 isoform X3 n=1 Tax=Sminthopsis crassicaudata TaxID=9301 RepID=UPI003D68F897